MQTKYQTKLKLKKRDGNHFLNEEQTRNYLSCTRLSTAKLRDTFQILHYKVARDRASEIAFTRIKHTCSSLKADLFGVNIVPSALCSCGPINETADHYFFHCPLYGIHKNRLLASIL